MNLAAKAFLCIAVLLIGAVCAQAQGAGVSMMVPMGRGGDAISSDGTDPKTWDPKLDAPVAAPASHKIIYEDDDVRVLYVTIAPGQTEPKHHHKWPSILVVLDGSMKGESIDANGHATPSGPLPPDLVLPVVVRGAPEGLHANKNTDPTKPMRLIRIEFKHGFPKNPNAPAS